MAVPSLFIDTARRKAAGRANASAPEAGSQWVTGRVTETFPDIGWVEVEVPADAPVAVAMGPAEASVSQVGAVVRVLRDASGRVQQVSAPLYVDESEGAGPVVSMGATGDQIAQAMKDAAAAFTAADEVRGRASAAEAAGEAALNSANAALKAAENAVGSVFSAEEPVDPPDSLVWYVLNGLGQVTGVKVRVDGAWVDRPLVGDSVLVPSSVGTVAIQDGSVTAPKVYASEEMWAKLAAFGSVTTDMLTAGKATITGDAVVGTLTGNKLVAGDSKSTATVGPLSTGLFGIDAGTTGAGRATLAVKSSGPYLQFKDGAGAETFYVDGDGNFRMKDRVRGGTVALDNYLASWTYTKDMGNWYLASHGDWSWEFFNEVQYKVMSPTGRLRLEHRLMYDEGAVSVAMDIQLGLYTANPTSSNISTGLYRSFGWANFQARIGVNVPSFTGSEVVDVQPGVWYWARAFWRRQSSSPGTLKNSRYWSQCQPI